MLQMTPRHSQRFTGSAPLPLVGSVCLLPTSRHRASSKAFLGARIANAFQGVFGKFYDKTIICDQLQLGYSSFRRPYCLIGFSLVFSHALVRVFGRPTAPVAMVQSMTGPSTADGGRTGW